ncbi:MAG: ribosome-associated translation inhibitor RaiA [Pirellulaceae bacterium]|nr:ribosome-associated translation inhibitor RaiA [Planctomycetaceae bacterium]
MQLSISARHGQLTESTHEKIQNRVEKLVRFFDRVTSIVVTVDLEHSQSPEVEVCVSVELAEDLVAANNGSNVLAALDSATRKMEQQLRKHKEKLTGHRSTGVRELQLPDDEEE